MSPWARRGADREAVREMTAFPASAELLRSVSREDELVAWEADHRIPAGATAPGDATTAADLRGDHGR